MKRGVLRPEQLSKETDLLFDVLNEEETDVALVVVAAAFLDASLAGLLATFMVDGNTTDRLLSPAGAIGGFQVRADLCYALGLVSKPHYQELCVVARIRNHFAHSHLKLSFTEVGVQELCEELTSGIDLVQLTGEVVAEMQARNKFILSVVLLSQRLMVDGLSVTTKGPAQYPRSRQMK